MWFTGLPCSGKTTVADGVAKYLRSKGAKTERLDGDIVRKSLTKDLGFSKQDRDTNIDRVVFVSKLLSRNGVATLISFVAPYRKKRAMARGETTNFIEVYLKCPVEICRQRDVKGMYKKALAGEIKDFTGVDDPYEEPENPEITLETSKEKPQESVKNVIDWLSKQGLIKE